MPLPVLIPAIMIAAGGSLGLGKGVKATADSFKAKSVQSSAKEIVENAKVSLRKQQKKTGSKLENLGKLKTWTMAIEVDRFLSMYQYIKGVELQDSAGLREIGIGIPNGDEIEQLKNHSLAAQEISNGLVTGVAGGAVGGAIVAFGAYSLVGALGVASTGTAIATLSGVVATNATLAWFGGGALAVGGLGMAGGTVVLGGLVAAPVLLIMGFVVGAKAKAKLNDAYTNLNEAQQFEEEAITVIDLLKGIRRMAKQMYDTLEAARAYLAEANRDMYQVLQSPDLQHKREIKWRKLSPQQKERVFVAAKCTQLVKTIVDIPILDETGKLIAESELALAKVSADMQGISSVVGV